MKELMPWMPLGGGIHGISSDGHITLLWKAAAAGVPAADRIEQIKHGNHHTIRTCAARRCARPERYRGTAPHWAGGREMTAPEGGIRARV